MTAPRLVIFDIDGTLIDSQDHIVAAMAEAFAAIGLPLPPRADVLSIVGLSLGDAVATLLPGSPEEVRATAVAEYKAAFGRLRAGPLSPLFPGALAALDALAARKGVALGIATGKSRRGLDHVLDAHGLSGRFVTCQVADDHPSKPHPSMLRAALSETGVRAGDAVMLGDTTFDVEMARAAGMPAFGVCWGYHRPEALTSAGATRILGGFGELDAALDALWGTA